MQKVVFWPGRNGSADLSSVECSCLGWLEVGLLVSSLSMSTPFPGMLVAGVSKPDPISFHTRLLPAGLLFWLEDSGTSSILRSDSSVCVGRQAKQIKAVDIPWNERRHRLHSVYTHARAPSIYSFLILSLASIMYWLCPGQKWAVFRFT